jgi:two-component system, LytTR family, sensor histidine kinase AlgZ
MKMFKNNALIMPSIKQNASIAMPLQTPFAARLPDFRNLGVCLRILLLVNLMALVAAVLQSDSLDQVMERLAEVSAFLQPALLLSLLLLYIANPLLTRLPYWAGTATVFLITLAISALVHAAAMNLYAFEYAFPRTRALLIGIVVTAVVLYYFNMRQRALSPALIEARLQALQARIRPHFLFNSINAVLSLMRSHPKRAEAALEDMADLFRVLMADNRNLVPLAQEIALSRQYLALEKLRLDERLNIVWEIDNMPPDALIPPLVLQPLLENAVYHGIEPLPDGGEITINIHSDRDQVHLILSNPYNAQRDRTSGNKMALTNIQERLALHFDAEASMSSRLDHGRYEVHIVIPYHHK